MCLKLIEVFFRSECENGWETSNSDSFKKQALNLIGLKSVNASGSIRHSLVGRFA